MKKIQFIVLSFIIAVLCLSGCKVQTVEQHDQEQQGTTLDQGKVKVVEGSEKNKNPQEKTQKQQQKSASSTEQKKETTSDFKKETTNSKQQDTALQTEKSTVENNGSNQEKTISSPKKESAGKEQQTKPTKDKVVKQEKQDKNTVTKKKSTTTHKEKNPAKQATVTEKKKYVTISIRVDTLLKKENYERLEPALQSEKYVPKNGVILSTSPYEIQHEDDSAWDITLRALQQHHIHFEYEGAAKKYGSIYVEGINHLYEKDAGKLSGWMYSVNGKNPGIGCGSYEVKDGDHIVWQYTVDNGRDIGL